MLRWSNGVMLWEVDALTDQRSGDTVLKLTVGSWHCLLSGSFRLQKRWTEKCEDANKTASQHPSLLPRMNSLS